MAFCAFDVCNDQRMLAIRDCSLELFLPAMAHNPHTRLQPIEFYIAGEECSSLFASFKRRNGCTRPQPRAPHRVISFPCSDIDDVLERNRRPFQEKRSQLALINAHGLWKGCAANCLTVIAHALEWAADDSLRFLQSLEKSRRDHRVPESRGDIA